MEQAAKALAWVECDIDPRRRVQELTRAEKSLVAIGRALATSADVLVLDEPTASLPTSEATRLFAALRPLKERGVGMIYVSHRLDEVFEIADRIVVLRDGNLMGERQASATTPLELVSLIVGRALRSVIKAQTVSGSKPRLSVCDLLSGAIGPVTFSLGPGEILGLVGLRGAGQERIGRALFGGTPFTGQVTLDGVAPDLHSPLTAMAAGIGLIARDRAEESVAAGLTIRENAFLNPRAVGRRALAALSPRAEERKAFALGARVGLRPDDPKLPIEALSGGNQQKVVVGRRLAAECKLLIAEDPTTGVDIGAKAEIHHLICRAAEDGMAVLVVSTDFEEVTRLCHRALVFSRGSVVAELAGESLTVETMIDRASSTGQRAA